MEIMLIYLRLASFGMEILYKFTCKGNPNVALTWNGEKVRFEYYLRASSAKSKLKKVQIWIF